MHSRYYIDHDGSKDGPHDLVTIMRRIRAQKIGPDTKIFVDDASVSAPASQIQDISIFFSHDGAGKSGDDSKSALFTLHSVLLEGWRFTLEYNVMTVFSGAIALIGILLTASLVSVFGTPFGGMLSVIVLVIFHYIYLICSLRLYRGQVFSADFMLQHLSPILGNLFFSAIVIAMMMVGGVILLIVPAVIVIFYYIFVPYFIMDRRMSLLEAMYASRLLVQKHNGRYQGTIISLILSYLGSLLLIIPLPLTMPMFAGALGKIYEELSTS